MSDDNFDRPEDFPMAGEPESGAGRPNWERRELDEGEEESSGFHYDRDELTEDRDGPDRLLIETPQSVHDGDEPHSAIFPDVLALVDETAPVPGGFKSEHLPGSLLYHADPSNHLESLDESRFLDPAKTEFEPGSETFRSDLGAFGPDAEMLVTDRSFDTKPQDLADDSDDRKVIEVSQGLQSFLLKSRDHLGRASDVLQSAGGVATLIVLPLLQVLGFDPFNPDDVKGRDAKLPGVSLFDVWRDGQLAGTFIAMAQASPDSAAALEEASGLLAVVARFDEISIWSKVAGEAGVLTWKQSARVSLSQQHAVDFEYLSRDAFDHAHFERLARAGDNIDEVIEAILAELSAPGSYFVEAVSSRLEIDNPLLHSTTMRRVAIAGARIADAYRNPGDRNDESGITDAENEDRSLIPMEIAALARIRELAETFGVSASRIHPRAGKSYTGVLLDNNSRKTICRLHFLGASSKYLGTFVAKTETRNKIESAHQVDEFESEIRARLEELDLVVAANG